ncbi:hypothetical protein [Afifella sp. IM 167]|uniref:hypothetical protein n=1 Tax=Afifella sp. IM 167 TaxID=2033586 RepID=UPI001CCF1E29|nr:hypothetical protein [Afifella sp. IM 167]MBZ8134526.1 hypothetical protein [Afifella sp. IM 167]
MFAYRSPSRRLMLAVAALASLTAAGAYAAVGERPQTVAAEYTARPMEKMTNVRLRFLPEGNPQEGHVKVLLTPESRPLTFFEARQAVQQAFLETLKEPGLPDELSRIAVTVQMQPEGVLSTDEDKTYLFIRKGAKTWTIIAQPSGGAGL